MKTRSQSKGNLQSTIQSRRLSCVEVQPKRIVARRVTFADAKNTARGARNDANRSANLSHLGNFVILILN